MPRPRKYVLGDRITSIADFAATLALGRYIIVKRGSGSEKRTHPSWAMAWPLRLCIQEIERGAIFHATPNPEHPDNKDTTK